MGLTMQAPPMKQYVKFFMVLHKQLADSIGCLLWDILYINFSTIARREYM
jgi:hypothetical protein